MPYSCVPMIPVMLVIIVLALEHTSEGIEYHVKPSDPEVTQCPGEPCHTLAEYLVNKTWDYTANAKVVFMTGHHRATHFFWVQGAFNFTLLGSTSVNHTHDITRPILNIVSIWFSNITYLKLTGIIITREVSPASLRLLYDPTLMFIGIFTLQVSQIAVHSVHDGIRTENVLGNSVIEHSSFDTLISLNFGECFDEEKSVCTTYTQVRYHHKISIQDCTFTDGSIHVVTHVSNTFPVQIDISNITILGQLQNADITLVMNTKAPYTVRIRDSVLVSDRSWEKIRIMILSFVGNQKIEISDCTLAGHASGIVIYSRDQHRNNQSVVTSAAPEIEIKRTIIRENSVQQNVGSGLKVLCGGINYSQPSVVLTNVLFSSNINRRFSTIPPSVVYMEFAQNISFVDCNFTGNRGTPITAYSSRFNVSGTLIFMNNTGYEGGALAFYDDSTMGVHNNTEILFMSNHAQRVGGAVFVESCSKRAASINDNRLCFFQLLDVPTSTNLKENLHLVDISFTFFNNKAKDGGDAIYGGMLHRCVPAQYTGPSPHREVFLSGAFVLAQNIATYTQPGFSKITSDPMRVCLCKGGKPDCTILATKTHYPGETFTVSAVVVGEELGTVNGTVYAQFLPLQDSETEPSLRDLQQSQRVGHDSCTELKYSIQSLLNVETLVLTAQDVAISPSRYLDPAIINQSATEYQRLTEDGVVVNRNTFHQLPVYLNITLLPCPLGFMLSSPPAECVCHTTLQYHNISCTIDNQMVHRSGLFWLNASFNGNYSDGAIVHKHCPFGYCNPAELDVDLRYPDTQCAFNHSGTLCGACQPGLSLALGTSQCLSCSNSHLSLLILFAVLGLILVCLIKALNFTVSEGAINGLIFYANIVGANQAIFFPPEDTNALTVFIAWLNLDFGFQTCFFKGFNSYWKTWLQFVFPAYVWIIVALIIVLSHYISLAARIFGSNSVPILATLFLLSYSKLLRTIITSLSFTFLEYPNGSRIAVWTNDGNIPYFSTEHVPLFLVAMAVLLLLWVPYTTLLLFVQCLQKKTNRKILRWVTKLKPFFDAYFGPFKDRHRYWVGAMLLVRVLLLLTFAANPTSAPRVNLLAIATTSLVILMYEASVGNVYKKWYLTLLENSFVLNLGMLAVGTFFINQGGGSQAALVYTSVGVAFTQFVGIATVYAYTSLKEFRTFKAIREKLVTRRQDELQNEREDVGYELLEVNSQEHGQRGQPRSLVMNFDELREPVLEYAD